MPKLIVHITDPAGIDQQVSVRVKDSREVGRAVHLAIDTVLAMRHSAFSFPLFIDIHPGEDFAQVEHFYQASRERKAGTN